MTEKQRVRIAGQELFVARAGEANAPSVLLVHGVGASNRSFAPLVHELAAHFNITTIDLPGFGKSAESYRPLDIKSQSDIVGEFINSQKLHNPLLVGHSMGCQIIAHLLKNHPGVSNKAILIAPTTSPHRRSRRAYAAALMADMLREPFFASLRFGAEYVKCSMSRHPRALKLMLTDAIEDQLQGVEAKVLVLCGEHDKIVPPGWAKHVADLSGGAYQEIAGAAHLVQYARPAEVSRAILRFAAD